MAQKVKDMLHKSIEALVDVNADKAREVLRSDDEVDAMNREMYAWVHEQAKNRPKDVKILLRLLSVSRCLERIADYTTNIAEDVVYMIEGQIIRHQGGNVI